MSSSRSSTSPGLRWFAIFAIALTLLAPGLTRAQDDIPDASGSPVSEQVESAPAAPPASLVPPQAITVDTTAETPVDEPCRSLDSTWTTVRIAPVFDQIWSTLDGLASGNLLVDLTTSPISISWDALGGGSVSGVVVADYADVPASDANFYDYRPYSGSVGGDAGLVAPGDAPGVIFLCVVSPATQVEPSATSVGDVVTETVTVPTSTALVENGSPVLSAAIGIGSSVRIAEPLNLRTAPGLDATVIAVLSAGTVVTVIGGPQTASGYTWWQLSTPSGNGWSAATYLIEEPVVATATRTATRTPTRTATVTPGSGIAVGGTVRVRQLLNLRAAPGTSATVVVLMPAGIMGTVIGGPQNANGMIWWQLSTSLGTGWAAGNYLDSTGGGITSTPTRTSVSTSTATRTATGTGGAIAIGDLVRTTARVNLRATPGTQGTVLVVLPSGTQATVTGGPETASGLAWWQVQTTAGPGWVASNYLARVGVAPTVSPSGTATVSPTRSVTRTPSATGTRTQTPSVTPTAGSCGAFGYGDVVRTNSSVNFRSTPSTSASIIRTLSEGEQGTVLGGPTVANGYTWCQVQVGSATGWVASQYLTRVSGPRPTPNGTVTPRPDPPEDPGNGSASVVYSGSSSSGMIALTFDAGADRGMAAYILDVLADYGVHATFGMTGTWARDNPDLVARMVSEGHQLINHTWNHPSFTGGSSSTTVLTRAARLDQLDRAEAIVEAQTGYQMQPYWRPPYGDINASVLQDVYVGGYYVTVMWTCDTLAWNGATEQQILNRCMYPMGAGDIILMHVGADGLDWAAVDNMIRYFQGQGLALVTVEELLGG